MAFMLPQYKFWADNNGDLIDLATYQLSLKLLEKYIKMDFGDLKYIDPLNDHQDNEHLSIVPRSVGIRSYVVDRVPELTRKIHKFCSHRADTIPR